MGRTGYRPLVAGSEGRRATIGGAVATWGFHAGMESYWAEVPQGSGRCLVVGPEHLVPTITALARVIAARAGLAADDVLVALLRSGRSVGFAQGPELVLLGTSA